MTKHKIAIITRTKDRNLLLRRAIESILGQTFQDWIMVIVNDGGNKEDLNRLVAQYSSAFKNRCVIIHNELSMGMEVASNIGIKSSDSAYVVIHDDDDSWHPLFLDKCVEFLDKCPYPSVAGVITYTTRILETIENDTLVVKHKEPYNTWLDSVTIYRMAAGNVFSPISFIYKRKVLDEIGYYREDLPVLGDWEFNLRFMSKYDIFLIPEELAYYHHRLEVKNGSYSNSVVVDDSKHKIYDTFLRNEFLRKDLERNVVGMGYLVNISKSFETVHAQLFPIEGILNRFKKIKWLKKLMKVVLWKRN